jgi:chromosome segregation ATPase
VEIRDAEAKAKEFEPRIRDLRKDLRTLQQKVKENATELQRLCMKVEDLKDKLESIKPTDNTKIAVLEAEIKVRDESQV